MPNEVQIKGRTPEEIKAAEEKKKQEELNKKNKVQPKVKKWFDIKLECLTPTTITYRILADDEQDALKQMDKKTPTSIKPNIFKRKNLKATVYDGGSSLIRFIKSFVK